jgi:hypothetical protein
MTGHQRRPTGPQARSRARTFSAGSPSTPWFEADLSRPAVDWMELRETERDTWRRVAQQVAKRIRVATERSRALGNYLPPPRCPAQRQDRSTLYICCRWYPHPADHGTADEGHHWVPVEP